MTVYKFRRFVDGVEMAEGVTVEREAALGAAIKRAVQICPRAKRPTVLVLGQASKDALA